MRLLDYESVAYSHPLIARDVLLVIDVKYELFYLPQFQ